LGDRRIEFDGTGERVREWGPRDWWRGGWHWAAVQGEGGAWSGSVAALEAGYAVGYVASEGAEPRPLRHIAVETDDDADGRPHVARYTLGEDEPSGGLHEATATVDVLAPIPLTRPDGRRSVLWRGLCSYDTSAGPGRGWAEWLRVAP
jgi:hypothetical protein